MTTMQLMPSTPRGGLDAGHAARFLASDRTQREKPWDIDPKGGFDIGWEYAQLGQHLPRSENEADEAAMREVRNGFAAGAVHFQRRNATATGEDQRFVRKYLQLKLHAWMRGRIFKEDVTPEYLKRISQDICPITRKPMTVATGRLTDGSVDRLLNDGCYARGNLVMISTGANQAKGKLSYREVLDIVAFNREFRGLSPIEWERMAALMGIVSDKDGVLPLLVMPPPGVSMVNRYAALQLVAVLAPFYSDGRTGITRTLVAQMRKVVPGKKAKKLMEEFFRYAWGAIRHPSEQAFKTADAADQYQRFMELAGDIWRDPYLLERFRLWMAAMPVGSERACVDAVCRVVPGILRCSTNPRDWELDKRGYVS